MEFPQKTKNRTVIGSNNCIPGHITGQNCNLEGYMHPYVQSSTSHNSQDKETMSKCPSTDEWIKKTWYIYTMEYYSAIKKNELMPSAATWMELEIITPTEVSQKKKANIIYHLYAESKI